jgi:glycosyltransferase involved in cell wall biosynthesis
LHDRAAVAAKRRSRPGEPRISVVIPALNEAENLPLVLRELDEHVHEIVLVDGGSIDDTPTVARRLHPRLRTVAQPHSGKGDALRTGFAAATGDIIVTLRFSRSTTTPFTGLAGERP